MRTLFIFKGLQCKTDGWSTPFSFGILGHRSCIPTTGEAMHHNPHIGRSKIVSAYLMVKYLGAHQGFSGLLAESVVGALQ